MYFSATIFAMIGFKTPPAVAMSIAGTNLIFTIICLLLIDKLGRRLLLLLSIPAMMVGLILAAVAFRFLPTTLYPNDFDHPAKLLTQDNLWALIIVASMVFYVAAYAMGIGNVPWQQAELFPMEVRSVGAGIATSVNWISNFAVGLSFLLLLDAITPTWTFAIYAAFCAVGWLLIYFVYPEMAGKSLEEAGEESEVDP